MKFLFMCVFIIVVIDFDEGFSFLYLNVDCLLLGNSLKEEIYLSFWNICCWNEFGCEG